MQGGGLPWSSLGKIAGRKLGPVSWRPSFPPLDTSGYPSPGSLGSALPPSAASPSALQSPAPWAAQSPEAFLSPREPGGMGHLGSDSPWTMSDGHCLSSSSLMVTPTYSGLQNTRSKCFQGKEPRPRLASSCPLCKIPPQHPSFKSVLIL